MGCPRNQLRKIPKVDALLEEIKNMPEMDSCPRVYIVAAIREVLAELRQKILKGECESVDSTSQLHSSIIKTIHQHRSYSLRPVINATGVILHTNLGRSVLNAEVAERVVTVASNYSNLEYDLETGTRGNRHIHVENVIKALTGCEAALVVNNNAAAILLILTALFKNSEVIVSRGELVEVGGSFRIQEIIALSGAVLKEVGATNRSRPADYADAINPERSGALLKVHTSNFRMIGFTESTSIAELAILGRQHNLPLVCDAGSGTLLNLGTLGIDDEPTVQDILNDGADIVCFSGDKLLGGVQAGLILGRKKYIDQLKQHQLMRALRVDKMALAALEATLHLYLDPLKAKEAIPVLAMLYSEPEKLKRKAEKLEKLLKTLAHFTIKVSATESRAGGGAAPEKLLPSWAVSVRHHFFSADDLNKKLRCHDVPIISRIFKDHVLIDVRSIFEEQFIEIFRAMEQINSSKPIIDRQA